MSILFFSVMSFLILHIAHCLSTSMSAFSISALKDSANKYLIILPVVLASLYTVYIYKKISIKLLLLLCIFTSFYLVEPLVIELNKIILFMSFAYVIVSYFIYQNWSQALELACYNPRISQSYIDDPILSEIKIEIKTAKNSLTGVLSNWDNISCFIHFDELIDKAFLKESMLDIEITHDNTLFLNKGRIVSLFGVKGVGVLFEKEKIGKEFDWEDFYRVSYEKGFMPEYLTY